MLSNLLAGILVLILGVIVTMKSGSLGEGLSFNEPGPGFFPRLIGIGLISCGLIESLWVLRALRSAKTSSVWRGKVFRGWVLLAMLGCYVAFLGRLPYMVSTAAFLLIVSWFLGARHWVASLVISTGLSAVFFAIFKVWLKIPLP